MLAQWKNDTRSRIKVSDLLGMESVLAFNEDYGDVADVTRMLYLDPDMQAMELKPNNRIVTIGSGGCNMLAYLSKAPAS
ncbi:DUF3419 family protein, partial [Rhizobium ruizarguesonis]